LQDDIEAVRFDTGDGKIELPVKLKVHDSIFVPLAKWAMLLTGNYRCVTKDGAIDIKDAVHRDLEASRAVYNFVVDLCVKLGANRDDLVPFEKYAAAAQSLTRPSSAARALNNGVPNIERADKLVQLIAAQKGLRNALIDGDRGIGRCSARGQPQEGGRRLINQPALTGWLRGGIWPDPPQSGLPHSDGSGREDGARVREEIARAPCPRNLRPTRTSWQA